MKLKEILSSDDISKMYDKLIAKGLYVLAPAKGDEPRKEGKVKQVYRGTYSSDGSPYWTVVYSVPGEAEYSVTLTPTELDDATPEMRDGKRFIRFSRNFNDRTLEF